MAVAAEIGGRDARVIGLVGAGHFLSHFYIFLLPPLFPVLKEAFGVSYVELGLIVTVFNVTSGLTQAPAGFLVDRFGAATLLIGGLLLEAVAYFGMGAFGSYTAVLVLAGVAGIANSVYHPADYAILSAAVREERIGRAFSLHTFAGFLGNAATPALVVGVAALASWQTALMLAGLFGLVCAGLMIANRDVMDVQPRERRTAAAGSAGGAGGLALLLSFPIVMCFLFYVALAMSQSGLSSFAPTAFVQLYGVSVAEAGMLLTVFATGNAIGILAGGQIADRTTRHELVAIAGFIATAGLMLVIAWVALPVALLVGLLAVAGVLYGLIMPSRDMLVRAVTPPGAMGKVFGFVSTGLNVGAAITPAAIGWVMDQGQPSLLFVVSAAFMMVAILTVIGARAGR
ncbi:MFS transporter [Desertibaculum subflavum]|uniref:MFS transporter n=1 Tax=Desertibaculum subflavum TaxID=2268458 RepID=UPI000E664BDB